MARHYSWKHLAAEFPTLGALAYFIELGSEEAFAEDMREYCYLVKKAMEKRSQLMSELGKLLLYARGFLNAYAGEIVSEVVAESICHYAMILIADFHETKVSSVPSSSLALVFSIGVVPLGTVHVLLISAGGELTTSVDGNASNGSVTGLKTASKLVSMAEAHVSVGFMSAKLMAFASTKGNFPLSTGAGLGLLACDIRLKCM
ncbi:hypothetical protein Tco_0950913 [Tanacetum coccineum]